MFPLFESIRCYNGRIYNIKAHNERVHRSRKALLGIDETIDVRPLIQVPESCRQGLYKCRLSYGEQFDTPVFSRYTPRNIKSLKLVEVNFDYSHKTEDRNNIDKAFALRGACDDILMVRDGLITDTSYANVAFYDGEYWVTPENPMLQGTRRKQLLDKHRMMPKAIQLSDLRRYKVITLFNAMIPMASIVLPIKAIK